MFRKDHTSSCTLLSHFRRRNIVYRTDNSHLRLHMFRKDHTSSCTLLSHFRPGSISCRSDNSHLRLHMFQSRRRHCCHRRQVWAQVSAKVLAQVWAQVSAKVSAQAQAQVWAPCQRCKDRMSSCTLLSRCRRCNIVYRNDNSHLRLHSKDRMSSCILLSHFRQSNMVYRSDNSHLRLHMFQSRHRHCCHRRQVWAPVSAQVCAQVSAKASAQVWAQVWAPASAQVLARALAEWSWWWCQRCKDRTSSCTLLSHFRPCSISCGSDNSHLRLHMFQS